jgi:precorrin-8X/cobalt-precorrin-8 methylmutase
MELPALRPTSPAYPYRVGADLSLARLRLVDALEPRVQPIWKLYGHGSVGSQSLLGLPAVCRLRDDPALAAISQVWPLETGFTAPATVRALIVHAEIWPGLVPVSLDARPAIRDQAQVRAVVTWLAELDHAGALGALFSPAAPRGQARVVQEEGWILGAGLAGAQDPRYPSRTRGSSSTRSRSATMFRTPMHNAVNSTVPSTSVTSRFWSA